MRKILNRVTITGADDQTSIAEMTELQLKYPWMEWGILLTGGMSQDGPRFPSMEWMGRLHERQEMFPGDEAPFSGHLCGKWVREVCTGDWSFIDNLPCYKMFSRYQLNFHAYVHKIEDRSAFLKGFRAVYPWAHQFLFQLDNVNNDIVDAAIKGGVNAQPFFDLSGGVGELPDRWQEAREGIYTGYAGGLDPDNVDAELEEIEQVCGSGPIWIDTETGVRTIEKYSETSDGYVTKRGGRENLDLRKVEAFLEACKPWVRDDWKDTRK